MKDLPSRVIPQMPPKIEAGPSCRQELKCNPNLLPRVARAQTFQPSPTASQQEAGTESGAKTQAQALPYRMWEFQGHLKHVQASHPKAPLYNRKLACD